MLKGLGLGTYGLSFEGPGLDLKISALTTSLLNGCE